MRNDLSMWLTSIIALSLHGCTAKPPAQEPSTVQCDPGAQKMEACNRCTCSDDGRWMCTMRLCTSCEPGRDQTCNDDATVSSLWGRCDQGQCVCNEGFAPNPESGRCRPMDSH